jgi:hypothetical protein
MRPVLHKQKGSIVLVALCFVAVLAIAVTTYLALSSRAMNLSNRSALAGLSAQLAEAGLEQTLSSLNNGSWTGWTDAAGDTLTSSDIAAIRTIAFASTKYGSSGVTTSIKLLLTNWNVSNWRSATSYLVGHVAWYRGQWYQCTGATGPTKVPPPDATADWVSAPGAWNALTPYAVGDIVSLNSVFYRCLVAHTSKAPPEASCWTVSTAAAWSSGTAYAINDTALWGGTVYKCIAAHSNQVPPNTAYWAGPPVIYAEGIVLLPDGSPTLQTQLRVEFAPAALFPNAIGATNATTSLSLASTGTIESYNSNVLQPVRWSGSTSYVAGDTVYYPATGWYYRALVAHSNQAPVISGSANTTYWTPARSSYPAWDASFSYQVGDMVTYNDGSTRRLYRCLAAHTNQTPPNATYWVVQMDFIPWSLTKSYLVGDLVANASGTVYQSILAPNLNKVLTNTSYWQMHDPATTPTWSSLTAYVVDDMVARSGAYYRCITAHSNHAPPNATYWAADLVGYPVWASGVTYAVGNVVYYQPPDVGTCQCSGMLYRCRTAHTSGAGSTPTNPSNWEVGTVGSSTWTSITGYRIGDIVHYLVTGLFYRCKLAHTNQAPASTTVTNTTYWEHTGRYFTPWSAATAYSVGDIAFSAADSLVYRCVQAHSGTAPPNASYWTQIGTDFATWSASIAYSVGDLVYKASNNTVYRCIQAHTGQAPPNATYWSTSMLGYSAVVAAPAVTSSSTAVIRGYVNAATTTFATNAVVQGPTSAASPKVDPTRVSSSAYVPVFDPPANYAALSGPGTDLPDSEGNGTRLYEGARTLGSPGATSPSVYNITSTYINGSSSSNTSGLYLDDSTDVLTIVGPVVLNVSGILYTNNGRIVVAPTGSLEIYFNSGQLYIGNNTNTGGGIINQTFDPSKMLIVSASTQNSSSYHYFWSWQPFHGLIYMPYAYLHKWNSGYNGEIYGAFSAKTVYFNHAATLDYDMALRTAGSTGTYIGTAGTYIERPYEITAWRELTDPAERISF